MTPVRGNEGLPRRGPAAECVTCYRRAVDHQRAAPLRGITPILVTTYDADDRIALGELERQAEHLAVLPVAALGIGLGSDIARLTDREQDALVSAVAQATAGRRPVMASAGANSVRAAVERATDRLRAGATVLMVTPPGAVASPTPDALVAYYAAIGREAGAPIVVQDAPGFTGTVMSAELLARIAQEVPEVVAIKIEAVPSAPKVGRVAALDHAEVAVLGGAGGIDFYHELERGADGTVPGVAMVELFLAVQALHTTGDRDVARALFNRHLPLLALATRDMDTFFATQLEILRARGITTGTRLRAPFAWDPGLAEELGTLLADLRITGPRWEPALG